MATERLSYSERQEKIELDRAKQYRENRRRRLIKSAVAGKDISTELGKEGRFSMMHRNASAERKIQAQATDNLKANSPEGAFWVIDPLAKTHTAGCLRMGGKNWTWRTLDRIHPLRHQGCRCHLISWVPGAPVGDGRTVRGVVMESRTGVRSAGSKRLLEMG